MRMLKTVYSAVESYYLLNNVYPAALEEISESMLSFKDTLRGIAENSLFDLKYSRSDATHYELTVTPKPELVSEGKVSSETYLFDNRDGKVTLKDASGAVLERLSLN